MFWNQFTGLNYNVTGYGFKFYLLSYSHIHREFSMCMQLKKCSAMLWNTNKYVIYLISILPRTKNTHQKSILLISMACTRHALNNVPIPGQDHYWTKCLIGLLMYMIHPMKINILLYTSSIISIMRRHICYTYVLTYI